jgi:pilus assembly protein CpaB
MNGRRVLGVSAAAVLAGLGAVGVVTWANTSKSNAEEQQSQTAVLIVDQHVPKGADAATILAGTHVGTVQRKSLAVGALTSDAQVGAQVAAGDMYPGEQVVKDRLAAKVDTGVPTDKVQVSATLTAERAVGGALKAGDTVGVYLSFEPFETNTPEADSAAPAKSPNMTHLEFQHVPVTNIQATSTPVSESKDDDTPVQQVSSDNYIVTLALTPPQSERFVFATEFGRVWLSNQPATVSSDSTSLITMGSIYSVVP